MASNAGNPKTVDAPGGGELVDICDEHFAPVPFSCRSATCATCHIEVIEGLELFEPPGGLEADLLYAIRAPSGTRLACQAVVRAGEGRIRVRPLE